jgi:uncharacterized protein (DUF362 family)
MSVTALNVHTVSVDPRAESGHFCPMDADFRLLSYHRKITFPTNSNAPLHDNTNHRPAHQKEASMNRRRFMKHSAAAGGYLALHDVPFLRASSLPYDLVAVKGGEPAPMFDAAMSALGGMSAFVKKGQRVVIKPNIGWDVGPERAGNTNPQLVRRIIEHCLQAGAKEVYVFDHTCDNWQRSYKTSGIETAVQEAGGKIAPAHTEQYYHTVSIPNGTNLKTSKEHELILESDVFINVPILKSHGSAKVTIAMKNLMGNVWDRKFWHGNDLHQCIADFATFRKPDLNIVDAYNVMTRNGPRGVSTEDVVTMKAQLVSTDIVAIDAAAVKMFGLQPDDVRYISIAAEKGVGTKALDTLSIKRISL